MKLAMIMVMNVAPTVEMRYMFVCVRTHANIFKEKFTGPRSRSEDGFKCFWVDKGAIPLNNPLLKVRLFPNRVAAARMRSKLLVGTGSRAVGRFSHGGQFSPGGDARRHDTMHKRERSAAYI